MSTCQIEVVEFGQAMERSWVQNRPEGAVKPDTTCVCMCMCPCGERASGYIEDQVSVHAGDPR